MVSHIDRIEPVAKQDVESLHKSEQEYGSSWKKRGGVGAFMMLARKWDRIEKAMEEKYGYDIFKAIQEDTRIEGIIDDIRDLRRYLLLVEAEMSGRAKVDGMAHPFGYDAELENGPTKPKRPRSTRI